MLLGNKNNRMIFVARQPKSLAFNFAELILKLVSMARIELALHAPKARVMPFHYTEKNWSSRYDSHVDIGWTPTRLISDCIKLGAE